VKLRVKAELKYNEKRIANILKNSEKIKECVIELHNTFEVLENMEDGDEIENNINEKWEYITAVIKETKQQLTEKDESKGTLKIDGAMRNTKFQ
jgi:hypothetical protein